MKQTDKTPNKNFAFSILNFAFISLAAVGALALGGADGCHNPTQPGGGTTIAQDTTSHNWTSTSHNWTYYIDTLPFSGQLNDVAIINDTCVYAVGAYYAPADTYQSHPYNIVHWDGTKWNYLQICWDTINLYSAELYSVYAFGIDSIIACNTGPYFYNGAKWTIDRYYGSNSANIHKIWGLSSQDWFGAADFGTILHWNGATLTQMASGTSYNLTDIFGISDTEIYACGANYSIDEGLLLKYNGTNWQTMIPGVFPIDTLKFLKTELDGILTTAWKDDSNEIYTGGDFIWKYKKGQWNFTSGIPGNDLQGHNNTFAGIHLIRGNNWNDLIAFGEQQTMIHYNGNTWQEIGPGFMVGGGLFWLSGVMKGNFAVAVGLDFNSGKPIAIRLYSQ